MSSLFLIGLIPFQIILPIQLCNRYEKLMIFLLKLPNFIWAFLIGLKQKCNILFVPKSKNTFPIFVLLFCFSAIGGFGDWKSADRTTHKTPMNKVLGLVSVAVALLALAVQAEQFAWKADFVQTNADKFGNGCEGDNVLPL